MSLPTLAHSSWPCLIWADHSVNASQLYYIMVSWLHGCCWTSFGGINNYNRASSGDLISVTTFIAISYFSFHVILSISCTQPPTESRGYEIQLAKNDIILCQNHLAEWLKPEKVSIPYITHTSIVIPHETISHVCVHCIHLFVCAWSHQTQANVKTLEKRCIYAMSLQKFGWNKA